MSFEIFLIGGEDGYCAGAKTKIQGLTDTSCLHILILRLYQLHFSIFTALIIPLIGILSCFVVSRFLSVTVSSSKV